MERGKYFRIRFIPAGAGNTLLVASICAMSSVHPRGCGEHCCAVRCTSKPAGSSPRVRGTRAISVNRVRAIRFIPAGAGNTLRVHTADGSRPVHPRGCGEHGQVSKPPRCLAGSSPRVRGTRQSRANTLGKCRFIPAGAGNTMIARSTSTQSSVHPRGCGEHLCLIALNRLPRGSSPRVRGTHWPSSIEPNDRRFIPAGAGNTVPATRASRRCPVHPRGCGEHARMRLICVSMAGSSPRVRGTLAARTRFSPSGRFIPAGAGNTLIIND